MNELLITLASKSGLGEGKDTLGQNENVYGYFIFARWSGGGLKVSRANFQCFFFLG